MHWAYVQNLKRFLKIMRAYSKELMRALSIRIWNLCLHLAYASGTGAYAEHTHPKLNDA
jgi:hypothetical protein